MMFLPFIAVPRGSEWLVILAIVVLIFGAAKLPDLARGTGQALRIFKAETRGITDDTDGSNEEPAELPPPDNAACRVRESAKPGREAGTA